MRRDVHPWCDLFFLGEAVQTVFLADQRERLSWLLEEYPVSHLMLLMLTFSSRNLLLHLLKLWTSNSPLLGVWLEALEKDEPEAFDPALLPLVSVPHLSLGLLVCFFNRPQCFEAWSSLLDFTPFELGRFRVTSLWVAVLSHSRFWRDLPWEGQVFQYTFLDVAVEVRHPDLRSMLQNVDTLGESLLLSLYSVPSLDIYLTIWSACPKLLNGTLALFLLERGYLQILDGLVEANVYEKREIMILAALHDLPERFIHYYIPLADPVEQVLVGTELLKHEHFLLFHQCCQYQELFHKEMVLRDLLPGHLFLQRYEAVYPTFQRERIQAYYRKDRRLADLYHFPLHIYVQLVLIEEGYYKTTSPFFQFLLKLPDTLLVQRICWALYRLPFRLHSSSKFSCVLQREVELMMIQDIAPVNSGNAGGLKY